ncbi:class I SAM-dependent methyltransferase [Ancylobacter pratisalsi]|uniref:Class I SAM-dependent methyltransferase n=1 Tax=Ancylobacter pratisalsi TaxID=1745854 RepID=A0A6P1YM87_9HYPH|nr:class I SAM-dependent methyltransferase [Ancylobacter pratisalsi]QIB33343.1 class I SAM-dependent methyltransferase [Ancylobacter pratisalsi]
MEFNGERFIPGVTGPIASEHQHRYGFASQFVANRAVLDVASGEGYGTAFLARTARSVIGVDVDPEAVAHAEARYGGENGPRFQLGDIDALPFPDASFDVVVSFETIEHVPNPTTALRELRRVLKPDGLLIISTPDRDVYTDALGNRNEFHLAELSTDEFRQALEPLFPTVQLFGQKTTVASLMVPLEPTAGAESTGTHEMWWLDANGLTLTPTPEGKPVYIVAVCSPTPQTTLPRSVLVDASEGGAGPMETLQTWANALSEQARQQAEEQAATIARQKAELAAAYEQLALRQEIAQYAFGAIRAANARLLMSGGAHADDLLQRTAAEPSADIPAAAEDPWNGLKREIEDLVMLADTLVTHATAELMRD